MQVRVRLFANLRDLVGADVVEDFDTPSVTVRALRGRLGASHPALAPHLARAAVAVNEEYVTGEDVEVREGDTVALIPPISGGTWDGMNETPMFLVTRGRLRPDALRDAVLTPASGAAVIFEGVVRNHHEGHAVLRLEYEAYEEMAERQLRNVAAEVIAQYAAREVHRIAIHHRIGLLDVGETSLVVAVSAAHRQDAFEAALRAVDRVKETVPVWKKEWGPDGAEWQEGIEPKPIAEAATEIEVVQMPRRAIAVPTEIAITPRQILGAVARAAGAIERIASRASRK
jgi:molybdopterin synthase catalytic subunit